MTDPVSAQQVVADAIQGYYGWTEPASDAAEAILTALEAHDCTILGPDEVSVPRGAFNRLVLVARFVSRGRGFVGCAPYPDMTARFALGALSDDVLARLNGA